MPLAVYGKNKREMKYISQIKKLKKILTSKGKIDNSPYSGYILPEISKEDSELIKGVMPFTMASPERGYGLVNAVRYIVKSQIQGAIVECGVWKGGSMMLAAKTLLSIGDGERELFLFDTFEGMPKPGTCDVKISGSTIALEKYKVSKISETTSNWCYASLEEVTKNMFSVPYNRDKMHFIKGKVEETIPLQSPQQIALLRLDTDWYESTLHELKYLFPRLAKGGILIIDDYGAWLGARKAVDEYFQQNSYKILLNRIDTTGRIAVKVE